MSLRGVPSVLFVSKTSDPSKPTTLPIVSASWQMVTSEAGAAIDRLVAVVTVH